MGIKRLIIIFCVVLCLVIVLQVNAQERALKMQDLKTVDSYRTQLKPEHIKEILLLSITTQHTIRPSFGVTEFVELQIKNPFTSEHTITIECDTPELR